MYELSEVFSPFSLRQVPYVIFACFFTKQKEARWRQTHRGKGRRFKESVGILTACKKSSQKSARQHLGFLMLLIWLAAFIRGWLHPSLEFCGGCNVGVWDVAVMTGNLPTDLRELTNPQNQKIFITHLRSECSFHLSLNKSWESEDLFLVRNSVSLLQKGA